MVWLLFVFNFFLLVGCRGDATDGHKTQIGNEPESTEIELFPPKPTYAGQTRTPRLLFKKLQSKAAFLAGLKLGTVLSKKGFKLGHGKIAATHSFEIFGNPVNSAMSLAYGNADSLLPLVDDEPQADPPAKKTALEKGEKKIYQVTVIENPVNETVEVVEGVASQEEEKPDQVSDDDVVVLYQDTVQSDQRDSNFLEEHNNRVKEFNESILRRKNSRKTTFI